MKSTGKMSVLALSTLMGLAFAGTTAAIPAMAADGQMRMTGDDSDVMMPDPMAMSYPAAAPGGLHLYHWSDYTRTNLEAGSVQDVRWDQARKQEEARRQRMDSNKTMARTDMDMDEDDMYDPAPLSYPSAAPGGAHLYHWKDYTRTELEAGSVPDARWEMHHKREMARQERMHRDMSMPGYASDMDDEMFDPAPLAYPAAAPGGVHLYHWKDYTKTEMEPGSVPDARWEKRRKEDEKRRQRMEQQGMSGK